ncbi:hypothetical protein IJ098_00380 [Candidatus Saccharibacteria bacterium]|nr:hypothetical protein [Candidatus Saccharibacteria bacterium]
MIFKKKKKVVEDPLEQRLDTISELTKGLGKTEFNNLLDAVQAMYEARQKLRRVKTDDEKEMEPINTAEKKLELLEEK